MPPTSRPARLAALTAALLLVPAGAAAAKDRDSDGLPDRWEKRHQVKKAAADHDADGLTNRYEFLARTHPRKRDTDGDRLADGREDADRDRVPNAAEAIVSWHPRDVDSDDDDLRDGDEGAGVISAVDATTVTLDLLTGPRVTYGYDVDTSVACDDGGFDPGVDEVLPGEDEEWLDEAEDEDVLEDEDLVEDDDAWTDEDEALDAEADACLAALQPGAIVYETEIDGDAGVAYLAYADLLGD